MKRIFLFLVIFTLFAIGFAAAENLKPNRAFEGAPPTIPHSVEGMDDCLICHKEGVGKAVKTPHPERVNCDQCHIAQ